MHQVGARLGKGGRLAYVSTYYQYPPLPVWGVVFIPHTPVWVPWQPGRPGAPQATSSYIFPVKNFFFAKIIKKVLYKNNTLL